MLARHELRVHVRIRSQAHQPVSTSVNVFPFTVHVTIDDGTAPEFPQ